VRDAYVFTFQLTSQELQDFHRAALSRHAMAYPQRKMLKRSALIFGGIALFMAALAALAMWQNARDPSIVRSGFAGFASGLAALSLLALWVLRRSLSHKQRPPAPSNASTVNAQHALILAPCTITVSTGGVTVRNEHIDTTLRWSGIGSITDLETVVSIDQISSHCYLLPARLFEGNTRATFVADARRWLSDAASSDIRSIHQLLRSADTACIRCGYNLRGSQALACPECGLAFNRITVPAAFVAAASAPSAT
jgi:hypothetical protein